MQPACRTPGTVRTADAGVVGCDKLAGNTYVSPTGPSANAGTPWGGMRLPASAADAGVVGGDKLAGNTYVSPTGPSASAGTPWSGMRLPASAADAGVVGGDKFAGNTYVSPTGPSANAGTPWSGMRLPASGVPALGPHVLGRRRILSSRAWHTLLPTFVPACRSLSSGNPPSSDRARDQAAFRSSEVSDRRRGFIRTCGSAPRCGSVPASCRRRGIVRMTARSPVTVSLSITASRMYSMYR